jgi:hypothetical protein
MNSYIRAEHRLREFARIPRRIFKIKKGRKREWKTFHNERLRLVGHIAGILSRTFKILSGTGKRPLEGLYKELD